MRYSVLFVCAANICRSPMAEALWKARVSSLNEEWRIASAGVWAQPGIPAAMNTLVVLHARMIDASSHRSQPVSRELIESYSLILTMERGQKEALRAAFPKSARNIFMLSEMDGEAYDVEDPVGGPLVDFEATRRELESLFESGFERICELACDEGEEG